MSNKPRKVGSGRKLGSGCYIEIEAGKLVKFPVTMKIPVKRVWAETVGLVRKLELPESPEPENPVEVAVTNLDE